MLPPGIFLWESGYEGLVSASSAKSISSLSPIWGAELENYGPWDDVFHVDGLGRFVKSSTTCETTVVIVERCTSSMEAARLLVEVGALGPWGACLAVEQTNGRGQLRRPWDSPPGNLHTSVVLPSGPSHGEWGQVYRHLLPLLCGYILTEGIAELGVEIRLKWPNDLLQNNRKVGGMLIEERNGVEILGFGLNLVAYPPDEKMREDRSVDAAVLQTKRAVTGALTLWETLVSRGKSMYVILLGELEPFQFLSAITNRLAWLGERVSVREGGDDIYHAEVVGISSGGGLVLRRAEGEVILFSGSIAPL